MKIEVELIKETRKRQFYTVRANDYLVCTHIWDKELADLIAAAVKEHAAEHGEAVWMEVMRDRN